MDKRLSRREFLGTATLGAGAVLLPSGLSASEVMEMRETSTVNNNPLKIGMMSYLIGSDKPGQ
ncbi:MAG: twin-arginine translocation signal domain-containing protein [Tannerellaceae bacterium]|nr:twin-arginine translocation signal domain-containing protein [Tannerellaceae bacterium]